jgi:hypothetical protein
MDVPQKGGTLSMLVTEQVESSISAVGDYWRGHSEDGVDSLARYHFIE